MNDQPSRLEKGFSWWHPKEWKPLPPAGRENERDAGTSRADWPQGDRKWRLNNPKKKDGK